MRPLRRWRLVEAEEGGTALVTARLRIDERVLHYIAGVNGLDARLRPLLRDRGRAGRCSPMRSARPAVAIVEALSRRPDAAVPLVQLWGNDAARPARRGGLRRRARRAHSACDRGRRHPVRAARARGARHAVGPRGRAVRRRAARRDRRCGAPRARRAALRRAGRRHGAGGAARADRRRPRRPAPSCRPARWPGPAAALATRARRRDRRRRVAGRRRRRLPPERARRAPSGRAAASRGG